jgi:hypothetical protein
MHFSENQLGVLLFGLLSERGLLLLVNTCTSQSNSSVLASYNELKTHSAMHGIYISEMKTELSKCRDA